MKLVIMVVNNPDLVGDIVPALVELDVTNIVAVETESVMHFLAQEVPIFAGLRELVTSPKSYNKTLFGLTDDDNILDNIYLTLKDIDIDLKKEGVGHAFTVPIDGFTGTIE